MESSAPRRLSQGIDYLGFLSTKLGDLSGYATLANELIQNAEDAKREDGSSANWMCFDIRDDALIVENNGVFSACNEVEADICSWKNVEDDRSMCDFHRFRNIASGDKRDQEGAIGAFGIGFIAVYQITDQPTLISSGRRWEVHPERSERERIDEWPDETGFGGTRFFLPWAKDPRSFIRRRLRVAQVLEGDVERFEDELAQALPKAMLFLRHLDHITLRRNGRQIKTVTRRDTEDGVAISDDGQERFWHFFKGSFAEIEEKLRVDSEGRIERKRTSDVAAAVPECLENVKGLLYTFLPTQHQVGLPFHINADFFPSSDRKHISFEQDYRGAWNVAAVCAAAEAIGNGLVRLRNCLGHEALWKLLQEMEAVHRDEGGELFKVFWETLQPRLAEEEIVFTSSEAWQRPDSVFFLQGREEELALPLLEQVGISIVHPGLRPYSNLLRDKEIGVDIFKAIDLARALYRSGLDQPVHLSDAPGWIRSPENRDLLGREIELLLDQNLSRESREASEQALGCCAVALDTDGWFRPPKALYRADSETIGLFQEINTSVAFVSEETPWSIQDLVPDFDVSAAVEVLENTTVEQLEERWESDSDLPLRLVAWFSERRPELNGDVSLRSRFFSLSIMPSGGKLLSLREAVIPGSFEDPLNLASIVDLHLLRGYREFLLELGAQELTLQVYASEQIPQAFADEAEVPAKARLDLVKLLAEHLGELRDNDRVQRELAGCALVKCRDGVFRTREEVYFYSEEILGVLGDQTPVALLPAENPVAARELLRWIGVAERPRPNDILDRVKELIRYSPTGKIRVGVQNIFVHLGRRWAAEKENLESCFDELKHMAWLPARLDENGWYASSDVYTEFQSYLFLSQGRFLDINRRIQEQSSTSGFIDYLGIKTEPTTAQVVDHLLKCSSEGTEVNRAVYIFLSNHAEDPPVIRLRGKACLLLNTGQYVRPDQVFWNEHPFGLFRFQLDTEQRSFTTLFEKLGVRESPEPEDAVRVLCEISEAYNKKRLDDETMGVVMRCWELLSQACDQDKVDVEDFACLSECKVVPDKRPLLNTPGVMFFEDRSGLAEKFGAFLEYNVLQKTAGAWQAMAAVGVRPLSQAVEIDLVECLDELPDEDFLQRLYERKVLIQRILEEMPSEERRRWDLEVLDELLVEEAVALQVTYTIKVFRQTQTVGPEEIRAYFDRDNCKLSYQRSGDERPWYALARELSFAMNPDAKAGEIVTDLKEILSADSFEQADQALDECGYAPLAESRYPDISAVPTVHLGGEETDEIEERFRPSRPEVKEKSEPENGLLQHGSTEEDDEVDESEEGEGEKKPAPVRTGARRAEPVLPPAETEGAVGGRRTPKTEEGRRRPAPGRGGAYPVFVSLPGENSDAEPDPEKQAQGENVDQKGMEMVLAFERSNGWQPVPQSHTNPGYDVLSSRDGEVRYIEVKALNEMWSESGVGLSDTQFEFAKQKGEGYWLYVVERVGSAEPELHRIQNPAGLANRD